MHACEYITGHKHRQAESHDQCLEYLKHWLEAPCGYVHQRRAADSDSASVGILALQDLQRAEMEPASSPLSVAEVCTRDPLVTYPDESIGLAIC